MGLCAAGRVQHQLPLAYVRTLVLVVPQLRVAHQHPHGGKPALLRAPTPDDAGRLQKQAVEHFVQALQTRLAQVPGITIAAVTQTAISYEDERECLARYGADALVHTGIEGFGVRGSTQREVWMQVSARVVKSDGTVMGPYHAYGWEARLRIPLFKALITPDEKLAEAAGEQAGRELAHALIFGTEPLFADWHGAAIVPAAVPSVVAKRLADGTSAAVPIPALQRAADVLFQPAIPPFVPLVPPQRIRAALRHLGLQLDDFWTAAGDPDTDYAVRMAKHLRADYLFISRVVELALSDEAINVPDGAVMKPGVERRADAVAEAALIRTSDGAVVWKDRLAGGTAARTEYVRHVARLRTEEQCVGDAVRIAYAYLRFSLDDYRRSLVRERTGVVVK
ncbi:MAG: hypothetical protein ACP5VE_12195 [Chthonomonadales bacterium]